MTRVLWLSPWLRPLARVHADALAALGHEVLLVTSDQHPDSGPARADELVLVPSPKQPGSWPGFAAGLRRVRAFAPQVAVAELVRDPRWLAFTRGVPRVAVVHDDRPHGAEERRPAWEVALFDRYARGAAATVTFSRYVADAVREQHGGHNGGRHGGVEVLPLPSDVADLDVLPPAGAGERRDVVVFGRLNPYKNLGVTLAAWQAHATGPGWRGDELVLIGDGSLERALPAHARWERGSFRYAEVLPRLRRATAAIVHYRQASQSGVQVLAMQLGVVPIVSPVGALPEFQPPGETPIGVDDVVALAARLDELADPEVAARRGAAARRHYEATSSAALAGQRWDELLTRVAAGSRY